MNENEKPGEEMPLRERIEKVSAQLVGELIGATVKHFAMLEEVTIEDCAMVQEAVLAGVEKPVARLRKLVEETKVAGGDVIQGLLGAIKKDSPIH